MSEIGRTDSATLRRVRQAATIVLVSAYSALSLGALLSIRKTILASSTTTDDARQLLTDCLADVEQRHWDELARRDEPARRK